jgi:hypothetical protein
VDRAHGIVEQCVACRDDDDIGLDRHARNVTAPATVRPNGWAEFTSACDGSSAALRQDHRVIEIRAMYWDARVIAPSHSNDVTVLVRVTYQSIGALCGDLAEITEAASAALI